MKHLFSRGARHVVFVPLLATLLSAGTLSLAQPNDLFLAGSPFLALVGWVPFFWALRRMESRWAASLLGAFFGLTTTLLQNYWLAFFQNYAIWTIGGVALGIGLFGAILGPFLQTFLRWPTVWRPFAVGAVWAVYEFLRSNGFLGFPWGLAPYPFHQWTWFIQIVDVTGLAFLSFLVVSWNAWLAEGLESPGFFRWRSGVVFGLLLAVVAGYGFSKLGEPQPQRGSVRLTLVQQNADPWNSGDDLGPLRTSMDLSRQAFSDADPDLIVWSETSLRLPLQYNRAYYESTPPEGSLLKTIRANRAWWLFGNPYAQDPDTGTGWVNATVLVDPQGRLVDYYGKIQQVPFAEYVPFWEVPAVKEFLQKVVGLSGTWELGRKWTIFQYPSVQAEKSFRFATPICFEDAFPWVNSAYVRAGAEVLINLTNDGWSRRDSAQVQHHVVALFRAVENRVSLIRSTNSGVTSVINPLGQIVEGPLPYYQAGSLTFDLPLPQAHTMTTYTLWGDWLVAIFALVLVGALFCQPNSDSGFKRRSQR